MTRALALLTLALAACTDRPAADNDAAPVTDAAETAAVNAPADVATPPTAEPRPSDAANGAMPPFAEVPGAHPTAPEPAPIPAAFRGTYAANAAACADLMHPSRLTVSGRTVRYPERVLFGERFATPAPGTVEVTGKIEGSGEPATTRLKLDGNRLRESGAAERERCA